jgi:type I restriction enzyme R subunit
MSFTESNTVEAHLRDLLAGSASARPAQLSTSLAHADSKIADRVWHYVAPTAPESIGLEYRLIVGRWS